MPDLDFVLPHWLYWSGLILFPLVAMFLVTRAERSSERGRTSLGVAYLLLVTGGFVGLHRFYLRSVLAWLYPIPFIGILVANAEQRGAREALSQARTDIASAEYKVEIFQDQVAKGRSGAEDRLAEAEQVLQAARDNIGGFADAVGTWSTTAAAFAALIAVAMLIDAFLMPRMTARVRATDEPEKDAPPEPVETKSGEVPTNAPPPPAGPAAPLIRGIEALSRVSGEFVAYWAVIAVYVYYYEVIARYIFNSPTNWAHESMFLLFGMQYLISGAYAYLNDSHVRVDVFYARLSDRRKAIADVLTSVFFFIFAGTLLATGWIFSMDSVSVMEVSFTEWAIQYWPVKLVIFLGAVLILLQGIAKLLRDLRIAVIGTATPQEA